jgi:hypothetical protein
MKSQYFFKDDSIGFRTKGNTGQCVDAAEDSDSKRDVSG